MRESFQALTRSEQDAFLMTQLIAMDGGIMTASRRLKKKYRTNKKNILLLKLQYTCLSKDLF
jgi:hypothetical protein